METVSVGDLCFIVRRSHLFHRVGAVGFKVGDGGLDPLQTVHVIVEASTGTFPNQRLRVTSNVVVTDHVLQNLQRLLYVLLPVQKERRGWREKIKTGRKEGTRKRTEKKEEGGRGQKGKKKMGEDRKERRRRKRSRGQKRKKKTEEDRKERTRRKRTEKKEEDGRG